MLFVQLFPPWQRENQPTQRQIPVEYRLKRVVRIFRLGAELQSCVHNNGITIKNSKLIVGPIKRCVLGRKVTILTLCMYDQHLQITFYGTAPRSPDCNKYHDELPSRDVIITSWKKIISLVKSENKVDIYYIHIIL